MKKLFLITTVLGLFLNHSIYSQKIPQYLLNEEAKYIPEEHFDCQRMEALKRQMDSHFRGNDILKSGIGRDEIQMASAIKKQPYDVLSYNLFMDWYNPLSKPAQLRIDTLRKYDTIRDGNGNVVRIDTTKKLDSIYYYDARWSGVNEIKIQIDSANVSVIEFNSVGLTIDSIYADGVKLDSKNYNTPANKLSILELGAAQGDTITYKIFYRYMSGGKSGFYLYPKGFFVGTGPAGDSVYVEERIAYTMSEPISARQWMPCNDAPDDKAEATISVRVPKEFSVASNGMISEIKSDENSKTFIWADDAPITTYLMQATASIFKEYSDWYTRQITPDEKIEVKYYVWEDDYNNTETDGSKYNAQYSFRNTVPMMELYSGLYGEYPFKKYGMVAIQPFGFGGMEHQTMTSVNRSWLRGWSEGGIAHELIHQWLGDLITCATWNDVWINEGGATWGSALWSENNWGVAGYYNDLYWTKKGYFDRKGIDSISIYDVPINRIFGDKAILIYNKAAWVYHMLMEMLGRETYFEALRSLLNKYKFQSVETEDFKNSFAEDVPNPPVPFETFFEQWVYKAGYPKYEINTITNDIGGGKSRITVNVVQKQKLDAVPNIPDVFKMPLELIFSVDSVQDHREAVIDSLEEQSFVFELDFKPSVVWIDTNKVLSEILSSVTSVHESEKTIEKANVFPNPVKSGNIGNFSFYTENSGHAVIEIIDRMGRTVKELKRGYMPGRSYNFQFTASDLPAGAYIVRFRNLNEVIIGKFIVVE